MPYKDESESDTGEDNNGDGVGDGWVNMKDFDKDGYWYAQERERLQEQWPAIENQLTAAYLECQATTSNWTTKYTYLNEVSMDCRFDILGQKSESVKFCQCLPQAIQLIHQGFLPSSPKTPRTAFSIRLLQLHHHRWLTSVCSISGFIKGLMNFLNSRSARPMKAQSACGTRRNLTQPFSNASHAFSQVKVLSQQVLQEGLKMKPTDMWAGRCPWCFGPAQDEHEGSAKEPDVIICMDGNFQHQHNILASKDDPPKTQYPSIFIPPSQIAQHNITVPAVPLVKEGLEVTHKAADDTRGKSTWDKCDETGLFAAACCHDVPLAIVNLYQSGENTSLTLMSSTQDVLSIERAKANFGRLSNTNFWCLI
ncbi:hypothetical protein DFH28DRAFT_1108501 [Melampsora americana]|nr:hypothetical protein DFH28DRAFT_1108501 [Melampsora americana]